MIINTYNEESYYHDVKNKNRRGLNVFTMSEIIGISGMAKTGNRITAQVQIPIFILSPIERETIARMNSYIFGIVLSRMNRISSLKWDITKKSSNEDRIVEYLKTYKQIHDEYGDINSLKDKVIRRKMYMNIKEELPDVKEDLSNFDASLRRWKKLLNIRITDSSQRIQDWIENVNNEDDFEIYKKKWVFDLLIHGSTSHFKKYINGVLEDIYMLPGGSVYPLRSRYVGGTTGYAQILPGFDPKIYFQDEMIFNRYVPTSARSYGLIPLEALINKIAESLLFDKLAADRADGTKPPEKIVVFGEKTGLMGDLGNVEFDTPIDKSKQTQLETKLNEERKNAVITLSGYGTPIVMDISKADTFQAQSERQSKLLKDIALVFNTSNIEINLTGGDNTSGRTTSESQERIEREKGIYPIVRMMDKTVSKGWIPFKFGGGWVFEHKTGLSDEEQLRLETMKIQTGTYDVNQIREERGDEPYPEDKYERPPGNSQDEQGPGSSEINPMYTRQLS